MQYYASKISDNMAETPEGFLICKNVPIARTGPQKYTAEELPGIDLGGKDTVTVYREADDVFSDSAVASFEAKPVTDEHPESPCITPENACEYSKGSAVNIRRDGNYLIADLMITDASLIQKIKTGKRDVSCGYNARYEIRDGKLCQVNIEGNHVAVVDCGRAGSKVAIKDSAPAKTGQKRRMYMKKSSKTFARLWSQFTSDSKPDTLTTEVAVDDFAEAIKDELKDELIKDIKAGIANDTVVPAAAADTVPVQQDSPDILEAISAMLERIVEQQDEILARVSATTDSDPLEELEAELLSDSDTVEDALDESEVLADAEEIGDDSPDSDEHVADGEPHKDTAAALREIRRLKPIIANIKDPKEKKMMTDSLVKLLRPDKVKQSKSSGGYQNIVRAKRSPGAQGRVYMKDSRVSGQAAHLAKVKAELEARRGVR